MAIKTVREKELQSRLLPIIKKHRGDRGALIPVLQETQGVFGYLPRRVLILVANELHIPLSEVYSVVSFYSQFTTVPVGRHRLEVCTGTACYVKGSHELLERLTEKLNLAPGRVSADGQFSLSTTRCVGACSAAPVVKVGDELHGRFTLEKIENLLNELKHESNRP